MSDPYRHDPERIQKARKGMLAAESELLAAEGWIPHVEDNGDVCWSSKKSGGQRLLQGDAIRRVWRRDEV